MKLVLKHLFGCRAIVLLLLFILMIIKGFGQLQVNDICPDVTIGSVLNIPGRSTKLSDFSGKSVIIDFWSTRCLSCLQAFPHIDSLQQQFEDKIQFLLVTKESRATVEDFFRKHSKVKMPNIPVIVQDKTLSRLFPEEGYPYTVWLDNTRKVKYLTPGYNTTAMHIEQFLKGDSMIVRYAPIKTRYAPLWTLYDTIYQRKVGYFSSITSCINGLDIGCPDGLLINEGKSIQISCNCCTLQELFKKAYGEMDRYPVNTKYGTEVFLKDSASFIYPTDMNQLDAWKDNNTYNYQLVIPATKRDLLYKIMQEDLSRYFDVSATRSKRKIMGYALVPFNPRKKFSTKGGKPKDPYNDGESKDADVLKFNNQPIERLYYLINYWIGYYYPLTKHFPYKANIDFNIRKTSIDPLNIESLRQDLQKSNLDLRPIYIQTDVLTLKDKGCSL